MSPLRIFGMYLKSNLETLLMLWPITREILAQQYETFSQLNDIASGISALIDGNDDHILTPNHLCFIMNDPHHMSSDDLEEMDILNHLASLSIKTNKLYKRT
ncbi:hypothetical protein R6Q57_009268, partial [Mikania cordata]